MLRTDPDSQIRIADRADEDNLMDMVREMHPEAALRLPDGGPIPFDEEKARGHLHRAIIPNRNGPDLPAWIGIVGELGKIKGAIYLSMTTTWYSNHVFLAEDWLFVRPAFRKSSIAAALISFSKTSVDAVNAHPLIVGHMSAGREEAKARFYARHLGKPLGTYFQYNGAAAAGAL